MGAAQLYPDRAALHPGRGVRVKVTRPVFTAPCRGTLIQSPLAVRLICAAIARDARTRFLTAPDVLLAALTVVAVNAARHDAKSKYGAAGPQ